MMRGKGLLLVALVLLVGCRSAPSPAVTPEADAVSESKVSAVGDEQEEDGVDIKAFEDKAREFVRHMGKEDEGAARSMFDATMSGAVPPGGVRGLWQGLELQLGDFVAQEAVTHQKAGEYHSFLVRCRFEKDAVNIKVVLDAKGLVSGLFVVPVTPPAQWQAPEYADPARFTEQEVTVGKAPWALPGTLTIPASSKGKMVAVVLVHGSGPNDRDESIGGTKVFKDLAWGLASRGLMVLRYDKRTRVHGAAMVKDPTQMTLHQETVEDAALAAAMLRQRDDVRAVVVVGHSLGASAVPRIAAADPQIDAFVAMAPTARALEDIQVEQVEYIINLDGEVSEVEAQELKKYKDAREQIKALTEADKGSQETILSIPAGYWFDLKGYEPHNAAKAIAAPLLVLQGERDYQVTMEDFRMWSKALQGRPNVTMRSFAPLNHLFIAGQGLSKPAEYMEPGNVDVAVIDAIGDWMSKVLPAAP